MNEEQRLVYCQSRIACAMITAMGMQAENQQREFEGKAMAYTEAAFQKVIEEHGIHHNGIISEIMGY